MKRIAIFVIFSSLAAGAGAEDIVLPEATVVLSPEASSEAVPSPAPVATPPWDHAVPFAKHVRDAAQAANVRPELLHALIYAESGYRPGARSSSGAVGLMQLMPGVLQRFNVREPLDPRQNIHAGARYVRELLDRFENNVTLVLAAYNAGEYAVIRHGNRIPPFAQTRAFVPKVMALYDKYVRASAGDEARAARHPH